MLDLRRKGRLQGYRLGAHAKQPFNRRRYWFFLKTDVEALKYDPVHEKRRRTYLRRLRPWEYEDARPQEPEITGPVTPGEKTYIPHDPRNQIFLETPWAKLRREMEEMRDL